MRAAVADFLARTARWTPRWFNKPKFHLLLHLPDHVERFGPAILFATEAFESFNAVIRAKSVHSNRQAPSRDIARSFAQCNRVRHILSGGSWFEMPSPPPETQPRETTLPPPPSPPEWSCHSGVPPPGTFHVRFTAGSSTSKIVQVPSVATASLGLKEKDEDKNGEC